MIIPSLCPICHDPLETSYYSQGKGMSHLMHKNCNKKTTHWLRFVADENATEAEEMSIVLSFSPLVRACWNFQHNTITVLAGTIEEIISQRKDEHPTYVPFFEPDLTDYRKLVTKVQTYLVFL